MMSVDAPSLTEASHDKIMPISYEAFEKASGQPLRDPLACAFTSVLRHFSFDWLIDVVCPHRMDRRMVSEMLRAKESGAFSIRMKSCVSLDTMWRLLK